MYFFVWIIFAVLYSWKIWHYRELYYINFKSSKLYNLHIPLDSLICKTALHKIHSTIEKITRPMLCILFIRERTLFFHLSVTQKCHLKSKEKAQQYVAYPSSKYKYETRNSRLIDWFTIIEKLKYIFSSLSFVILWDSHVILLNKQFSSIKIEILFSSTLQNYFYTIYYCCEWKFYVLWTYFFILSLESWENENFIANLRLLSLNGFILDLQIVKQKVLNIVIRQHWVEARVSCNKNDVIYVNSFSSDYTNVNKFGTFYCRALKSFNLLFAHFLVHIKKTYFFTWMLMIFMRIQCARITIHSHTNKYDSTLLR